MAGGADSTAEQKEKYRPQVLTKCVCTPGTECKSVIANAGVASVASTIFVRIAFGDAAGALRPGERSMRLNVLRRFLGGNGGRDFGSMELYADPLLHRLCWCYVS